MFFPVFVYIKENCFLEGKAYYLLRGKYIIDCFWKLFDHYASAFMSETNNFQKQSIMLIKQFLKFPYFGHGLK